MSLQAKEIACRPGKQLAHRAGYRRQQYRRPPAIGTYNTPLLHAEKTTRVFKENNPEACTGTGSSLLPQPGQKTSFMDCWAQGRFPSVL